LVFRKRKENKRNDYDLWEWVKRGERNEMEK
jgi:hypothetical protein